MKTYRVKEKIGSLYSKKIDPFSLYRERAEHMIATFGLPFTAEEVIITWKAYSQDHFCAGWLLPEKGDVEEAFGVVLEENNQE